MSIAAIILAAGQSTRFGSENKLLAMFHGAPMLVHVIRTVKAAGLTRITVITGHEAERIADIAAEQGVSTCHNPDFAQGLSTSLKAGVSALPGDVEAALVLLGDMPLLRAETILALISASTGASAVVPVFRGAWGNPVLISRALFPQVMDLTGDQGARKLLAAREDIRLVEVDDPGILADFDVQSALSSAQASKP
jgi:molybdenum cofactor cytidylyltransferase